MINNRQNGRRRGRGNMRPQNGAGNGPERGNRIDNRARGNASQLHEKYKTLARDAQTQGDRVMTEYYLQFADHYFRVLSESRARFEEQRRPRDDNRDDYQANGFDGDEDGEEGEIFQEDVPQRRDVRDQRDTRDQRDGRERDQRDYREAREPREQRDYRERQPQRQYSERPSYDRNGSDGYADRNGAANGHAAPVAAVEAEDVAPAPVKATRGRPRRRVEAEQPQFDVTAPERIEIDRLPPAFAAEPEVPVETAEEEVKPKRRGRPRRVVEPADSAEA